MKPEAHSRRVFGITRSKGRMFEFGLDLSDHLKVPDGLDPSELLVLTIGILGDVAADLAAARPSAQMKVAAELTAIDFAASHFDALLASQFAPKVDARLRLLASSAFYLSERPGSSAVLARSVSARAFDEANERILHWLLCGAQGEVTLATNADATGVPGELVAALRTYLGTGEELERIESLLVRCRDDAYARSDSAALLTSDCLVAVSRRRLSASAWTALPLLSNQTKAQWVKALRRSDAVRELWPAQILLGQEGFYQGKSGVVQMPTSAGKTRSVEFILRSLFHRDSSSLAIIVAPYRALCHEIAQFMAESFREDNVAVSEFADAITEEVDTQVVGMLTASGIAAPEGNLLVLTPEKLLYALRKHPELARSINAVILDEGHQFDSGSRGVTFELLLTEMRATLPENTQIVLISAVLPNGGTVAEWLVGGDARIVDGRRFLPTARSVAFASWRDTLGRLEFHEGHDYRTPDYFVPRVIEQRGLALEGRERTARHFPERHDPLDVALSIGLKLVGNGGVAVFCGKKSQATRLTERLVEVMRRDGNPVSALAAADKDECKKLAALCEAHFGPESAMPMAARLGVFVHHGTVPHGLRLAVEHAMKSGRVKFVACTSTLAQGVNLPVRYLLVPSTRQAESRIKVRDFQNLVGRAGRAGMHTEGMVIFTDTGIVDERLSEPWKFEDAVELLNPDLSEGVASSVLAIQAPFRSRRTRQSVEVAVSAIVSTLLGTEQERVRFARRFVKQYPEMRFDEKNIVADLKHRREMLRGVESFLLANLESVDSDTRDARANDLARRTLAHHMASADDRLRLLELFREIARYVHDAEPNRARRESFAATLLNVSEATAIEAWIQSRLTLLPTVRGNDAWLSLFWELFEAMAGEDVLTSAKPSELGREFAGMWLRGESFGGMMARAKATGATKPWGDLRRTKISESDVVAFCEHALGFRCALVASAVRQLWTTLDPIEEEAQADLAHFEKCLRYGVPDALSVSCYEAGIPDRVIAQELARALEGAIAPPAIAVRAAGKLRDTTAWQQVISRWPKYFAGTP